MQYIVIIIAGVFVNNIVLAQFLGICPFLGVSKKLETSIGMAGAVLFVMFVATIFTWLLQTFVLVPLEVTFLQTLAFILVIAALVQCVEIILKKLSPGLYAALGIFLPLITTNCAVLGVAILVMNKEYNLVQGLVYAVAGALGFGLALILLAGLREALNLRNVPKAMKGMPIALLVSGMLALAFMGFSGIVTLE